MYTSMNMFGRTNAVATLNVVSCLVGLCLIERTAAFQPAVVYYLRTSFAQVSILPCKMHAHVQLQCNASSDFSGSFLPHF